MPSPVAPAEIFTVAFEGFSDFERTAIASFFRLTESRSRAYRQSDGRVNSDFLVADADNAAALDAVLRGRRIRETVFVGARVPHAALAWLPRPIDPMQIVRELDSLVELRRAPQQTDFDFLPSEPGEDSAGLALQLPEVDTSFYNTEAAALSPPELDEPRQASRAELHAPAPAPTAPLEPAPSTRDDAPREVLVVEDSAIARKFLARRLQLLGYRVHTAASGEEALSQIAQHTFAIVFLDVVLGPPGSIDGLQLCQTLRKKAAHPLGERSAVVMVTGLAGPTDRVRGSLAGCHAYLTKPLIESDFIAALRQVDPHFEWRRSVPSSV